MEAPEESRPEAGKSRWYYSVWSVLLALFVVLGPVGLPLLWRSPHFSRFWKVVLTLLVAALLAGMIASGMHIYDGIMERLSSQGLVRS